MLKLLAMASLFAVLILPIVVLFQRKLNVSLVFFYLFLMLGIVGDMQGDAIRSVETMIWGVCGFALASGVEYAARREYRLGIVSACVLLLFAFCIYRIGREGAFSHRAGNEDRPSMLAFAAKGIYHGKLGAAPRQENPHGHRPGWQLVVELSGRLGREGDRVHANQSAPRDTFGYFTWEQLEYATAGPSHCLVDCVWFGGGRGASLAGEWDGRSRTARLARR